MVRFGACAQRAWGDCGVRFEGLPRRGSWRATSEASDEGGSNSVVESQPSKLLVAGSIPVSRSTLQVGDLPVGGQSRLADVSAEAAVRRRPM